MPIDQAESVLEIFRLGPLRGVDTTTAPYEIDDASGLFPDSVNIVPAQNYGGFSTALGRKTAFANTLPATPTGGAVWHRQNGLPDVYFFYVTDASGLGQLYYATLGGAFQKLTSYPAPAVIGYPPNIQAFFVPMQTWMFVTVGSGIPIKIDQNLNVTFWGIAPPAAPPNPANSFQTGNLLGHYAYCTTFAKSTPAQESSQGAITGTVQVSSVQATAGWNVAGAGATAGVKLALLLNGIVIASYATLATDTPTDAAWQLSQQALANTYAQSVAQVYAEGANLVAFATQPGTAGNTIQFSATTSNGAVYNITQQGGTPGYLSGGATGGFVTLTAIPQPVDAQVDTINVYRIGGSIGQWRLIASLAVGTTTFVDNIADVSVTGQALIVYRDVPPAFTSIASHQGRIFGFGTPSDPSAVWYSNFNEPWGFNSATGVLHADYAGFGDAAVACGSIGTVLLLLKQRSYYTVWGSTDADFQVFFNEDTGCASARSFICTRGLGRWLSRRGVIVSDGSTSQNISDGGFKQSNIKSVLDGLTANTRVGCAAFYDDRAYHLCVPSLGRTYRYDERMQSWWPLGWTFGTAITDPESDVHIIAADAASGEVDQWFGDKYDRGGAVNASITTRVFTGGINQTLQIEYVRVEGPQQPPGTKLAYTLTANPGAVNGNADDNRPPAQQVWTSTLALDGSSGGGINVRQDSVSDAMIGYDFQLVLTIAAMQQTYIGKVAAFGSVKRSGIAEG